MRQQIAPVSQRIHPLDKIKRRASQVRHAAKCAIEALEDRTLLSWSMTLGTSPTINVSSSTAGITTTFTATATGANLDWSDVSTALASGQNVVVNSGSQGTEAGNITDLSGAQIGSLPAGLNLTFESGSGTGTVGNISIERLGLGGNNESISIEANGDVSTGILSSGSSQSPAPLASLSITAANGSITSQSSPFPGPVYATTVALQASTGIGSSAAPFLSDAASLSTQTSTDGIFISNTGNLNISGGAIPGVNGLQVTTSGDINLTNTGNVSINTAGDNITGPGNITVSALGTASLLTVGTAISTTATGGNGANITLAANDMALNAPINAGAAGIVTLEQGGTTTRDIDLGFGFVHNDLGLSDAELGEVTASVLRIGRADNTGTVNITADVGSHNFGILHLISGGAVAQSDGALDVTNVAITTGNIIRLINHVNYISNLAANISGASNFLTMNDGTALTIPSGGLDGVVGITVNHAFVSLQADSMNIDAPINSGGGAVALGSMSLGRAVVLGSKDSGALSLTNAELNSINATRLSIGDFDTIMNSGITITAPITAQSNWNLLELFSEEGAIRQNSGASITVTNLVASAGSGVFLSDPGNTVSNLGGTAATVAYDFTNSTSFTVADLDLGEDADGVTSYYSPINLTALGSGSRLTVNAKVNANSFGSITFSADEISLNAVVNSYYPGTVTLEQNSTDPRDIDLGGGTTPGDFDVSDAMLTHITASVVRIGRADNPGNIVMTAPVTAHPGFNMLSLISGGNVTGINPNGPDITVYNLSLQTASGVNLDAAASVIAFENTSGTVAIRNTGGFSVDSVDAIDTSSNLGGNTILSATGQIDFIRNTTSSGSLSASTTETADDSGHVPVLEENITVGPLSTVQSTNGNVSLQGADGIVVNGTVKALAPGGNIDLSIGNGDSDSDAYTNFHGLLWATNDITLNIPAGDSATLSASANASQTIENGGGTFFVDGALNSGIVVNAGTLSGIGNIFGNVLVQPGAFLAPGDKPPGILYTYTGTHTLSAGSTFSVKLGGPVPGDGNTNYSQLVAAGDVNLSNATLAANLTFTPGTTTFTIIQAGGNITGKFAQGSTIVLNGITYEISYQPHSVVLIPSVDESVTMAGPSSAVEGSTASYTYTVSNSGPGIASNTILSAPIPSGAVFVSASFGGAFSTLAAGNYNSASGTANLGSLPPGAMGTVTLTVRLPEENPGVTFDASVASSVLDTNLSNNTNSITTRVDDAPLTASGSKVTPTHGSKTFSNVTVATFSDANFGATVSDFTAMINWGDGTVSAAQIVANGDGTFSVIGSHDYKDSKIKSYSLVIQILDDGGSSATAVSTAQLLP